LCVLCVCMHACVRALKKRCEAYWILYCLHSFQVRPREWSSQYSHTLRMLALLFTFHRINARLVFRWTIFFNEGQRLCCPCWWAWEQKI
jgi:hypothetical protein